jgi:hypothetical protein
VSDSYLAATSNLSMAAHDPKVTVANVG